MMVLFGTRLKTVYQKITVNIIKSNDIGKEKNILFVFLIRFKFYHYCIISKFKNHPIMKISRRPNLIV